MLSEEIDYEDILSILLDKDKLNLHGEIKTREAKALPPCNEDQLMIYLAEIQAINPENIINLSTLEDLTNLCK